MNNIRLEVRLLAHSIDACTFAVPAKRKSRKSIPGPALTIALALAALAMVAFAGCH